MKPSWSSAVRRGAGARGWRPARWPNADGRLERWACPARPSAGSGSRRRPPAPPGPGRRRDLGQPAQPARLGGEEPLGRVRVASSSARWCRRRAGAGWRSRCRRRPPVRWRPRRCRGGPRRVGRPRGWRVIAAARARRSRAATIGVAGALDHGEHLLEPVVPTVVRVRHRRRPDRPGRSRGTAPAAARRRRPAGLARRSARLAVVHREHQVVALGPAGVELPGAVPAGVVAGARSGWPRRAGPSARRRASRRCRSCRRSTRSVEARRRRAARRGRRRPWGSGRCCPRQTTRDPVRPAPRAGGSAGRGVGPVMAAQSSSDTRRR